MPQLAIVAPDANAAQERLRERLRTAFEAAGGEVTSSQSVATTPGRARIWIEGRLTLPQVEQLLVSLQGTPPYLVMETLRISADSALETGRLDRLDVRLEVSIPFLTPAS